MWEDGVVVYRNSTGDTHFLDPASAAVLIALSRDPKSDREALAKVLRSCFPDTADAADEPLSEWLDVMLDRLVNAGLAHWPKPPEASP